MMDRVLQKRPQLRPAFRRQPAQIAHRRVAAVVGGVGVPGMTEIAEGDVERRRAFEEWPGHGGGGVGDHAAAATGEGFEPFHCRRGDGLVLPEHEHGVEALRQRRRAGEHFLGDEHRRQADVGERVEHLERAVGVGLRVGCHGDLPLRVKQADSWTRGGFRQQPAELLHEATAERRLLALRAVGFEHLAAAISIGERRAHLEGVAGALGAEAGEHQRVAEMNTGHAVHVEHGVDPQRLPRPAVAVQKRGGEHRFVDVLGGASLVVPDRDEPEIERLVAAGVIAAAARSAVVDRVGARVHERGVELAERVEVARVAAGVERHDRVIPGEAAILEFRQGGGVECRAASGDLLGPAAGGLIQIVHRFRRSHRRGQPHGVFGVQPIEASLLLERVEQRLFLFRQVLLELRAHGAPLPVTDEMTEIAVIDRVTLGVVIKDLARECGVAHADGIAEHESAAVFAVGGGARVRGIEAEGPGGVLGPEQRPAVGECVELLLFGGGVRPLLVGEEVAHEIDFRRLADLPALRGDAEFVDHHAGGGDGRLPHCEIHGRLGVAHLRGGGIRAVPQPLGRQQQMQPGHALHRIELSAIDRHARFAGRRERHDGLCGLG